MCFAHGALVTGTRECERGGGGKKKREQYGLRLTHAPDVSPHSQEVLLQQGPDLARCRQLPPVAAVAVLAVDHRLLGARHGLPVELEKSRSIALGGCIFVLSRGNFCDLVRSSRGQDGW